MRGTCVNYTLWIESLLLVFVVIFGLFVQLFCSCSVFIPLNFAKKKPRKKKNFFHSHDNNFCCSRGCGKDENSVDKYRNIYVSAAAGHFFLAAFDGPQISVNRM